jgi:TolB-like protein
LRYLVNGSLGRRVSWTLITALLMPLLVLAMPPRQARAQVQRLPAVAVIDFGVLPDIKSKTIVGRSATDAVVVEMTRTGRFDVTPRTQTNQQLQALGLNLPVNNIGIQKLGQALGVDYVVSGDVTAVKYFDNPRRVAVTLSVRLTDPLSGGLSNGAISTGYSNPPPPGMTPDDDVLINQAITDASFNAVRTINQYNLPQATVLQTRDNTAVVLNAGGRDGMQEGMEMNIFRGRDYIGKVKVRRVNSTDAYADVVEFGKGIRPQDRARAVFKLPGYDVDPNNQTIYSTSPETQAYKPNEKRQKPILLTVLGIVAAVFLATLLFSSKSNTTNASGIGRVTARAFADGSVPASLNATAARVEITWQPASDIPINNIIEYQIFRDDEIIGVTSRETTRFVDRPFLNNFTTITYQYITFGNNPNGTPGNGGTNTTTTTTGGNTGNTGNTGGNNNNNGQSLPTNLAAQTVNVTPMPVGAPHRYSVRILYQQVQTTVPQTGNNTGGGVGGGIGGGIGGGVGGGVGGGIGGNIGGQTTGGNTGGTNTGGNNGNTGGGESILYRLTTLATVSGSATPISRAAVTGPTGDRSLNNIQVTFQPVAGADSYLFEFSDNPLFTNKKKRGPFYFDGNATAGQVATSETFDLSKDFSSLPAGGRVFIRVGAKNSLDVPGPSPRDTTNGDNFVYSANQVSFTKLGTPPPPPGN